MSTDKHTLSDPSTMNLCRIPTAMNRNLECTRSIGGRAFRWLAWMFWLALWSTSYGADTFVKDLTSAGSVVVTATAAHPTDGSVYVIGTFEGAPVTIGTRTLNPVAGRKTGFLAKMGTDGGWRWAGTIADADSRGSLVPRSVAVTANNVYMCGDTTNGVSVAVQNGGSLFTGGINRTNASRAPFVVKMDTEGRTDWVQMASNSEALATGSDAYGYDITVDSVGSVFVCGSFRSDQITDETTLGLNFGAHHAFRIRDTSGTSAATDWAHVTRDGYVAKLDGGGTWRWVATGGSLEDTDGGFFGIAVDAVSTVYVVGNAHNYAGCKGGAFIHAGCRAANWRSDELGGFAPYGPDVPTTNTVAFVARLGGAGNNSDGKWLGSGLAMATGQKDSSGCPNWSSIETRARDVVWVDNAVYVAYYNQSATDLHIARVAQDLSGVQGTARVQGNATNDMAAGVALSFDTSGSLYLSGMTGFPGGTFTNSAAGGVTIGTSLPQCPFVAKLSPTLTWGWVQTANTPEIPTALPTFGPMVSTVDPQTGRVFFGGSFANGILDLGPAASDTVLPPTGVQGANPRSFLSAILSTGEFLEQVRFTLITEFGVDVAVPPLTPQTLFRGQSILASVPPLIYEDLAGNLIDPNDSDAIRDRAAVRRICTGYEVLGTATAGPLATYGLTIAQDTDLRFNWKTEYALNVTNNLTGGQGGLSSTAVGNPEPVVQKHWVQQNAISTAFIDGVIPSPNPNEFGTRYRSTGYFGTGSAAPLGSAMLFTSALDLGNPPAYQPGNSPWTIELWYRPDALDAFSRRLVHWGDVFYLSQEVTSGRTNLVFNSANTFSGTVSLNAPLATNEWHHLAFVFGDGQWTIYSDGRVLTTQPTTGVMGSGTTPLLLGQFVSGAIDDFRMWRVARTAAEIQANMRRALPNLADPNLVAYWNFDSLTQNGSVSDLKNPSISVALGGNSLTTGMVPSRAGGFAPWGGVQARQQVPQFIMSGPATIEYRWVKENRIQVSVATAALANMPVTVSAGITNIGSGEFWYSNGASVRITAPETATAPPETYQLKGFLGGLGNVTTVTGEGTRGSGVRYYEIPALTQGSSITWDYSDRIYKGRLVIGEPIRFESGGTFVGSEAIPASDLLDTNRAPVATAIVSGSPPGSTVEDMRVWDDVSKKLYPLRPGVVLLEWSRQAGATSTRNVFTEITVTFPTNAHFAHIANTPPVPLDSDKTNAVTFLALKYSQNDKAIVSDSKEFSVTDPAFTDSFWSVLLFSERPDGSPANGDLTRERLRVRTVLTRQWDNGLQLANAPIGIPIASALHDTTVPHNGFVYFEKARYNAAIHNRESRLGPIFPVNVHPTARLGENLVVVWYRTQEGIHWPYQSVQYTPQWPSIANRIVVASRLGSEGVDASGNPQLSFTLSRYERVSIYQQPDRNLPGYNPNEEHAFIAPSLLNASDSSPPPAAFALRNTLNVTSATDAYTSDPFVLVQYFDKAFTNWNMSVYRVQTTEPNIPARRLDFALSGAGATNITLGGGGVVEFNLANYSVITGLRTNEAVDLEVNGNLLDVRSGRYYLLRANDNRFQLSATPGGAPITSGGVTPAEYPSVIVTRAFPYVFEYAMTAGEPVLAPYPLQQVIGATPCPNTRGENLDPAQLVYWEDHKKQPWAVSGSLNPAAGLRAQFFYPLQPEFWHPDLGPGDCVPYAAEGTPVWVTNHVRWPNDVPVLKAGETLTFTGGERNRDNPNAPGLPGVVGWAAGRVVYDDANPAMDPTRTTTDYLGRLASPLATIQVSLPVSKFPSELLPASGRVQLNGSEWTFKDLGASLQSRIVYDPVAQKLGVRGFLDGKTLGDPALTTAPGPISVLLPNILTARDSNAVATLVTGANADWTGAVASLLRLSRDPLAATSGGYGVGLAPGEGSGKAVPATLLGPGLALLPNPALTDSSANLREGYLTLAENDDSTMGDAPVALHIIRVRKQPVFRGAIQTLQPPNPFDEKITLRHSGDFGANAGDLVFEWYYKPDDGATVPPPDTAAPGVWSLFADTSGGNGRGMAEISLAGAGAVALSDNRFFVRWRHVNPNGNANWSEWAGAANSRPPGPNELAQNTYVAQLAEGWVKRVTGALNPYDARITDFRNNNAPATYASMVRQAGAPYRGPVALNPSQNVVENVGLIELYTTVVERAKDLSIDLSTPISTPAVNNAILLAASRVADLQLLLGNEAYTDAQDPTIGFGTASSEYGSLAPSIFCFQNQVATLLDEELALLRGRGEEGAYPAYNRLLWNFTRAEGEAAYALSYNITDVNTDGFINEADGRILYPQGHGDAWGHYLGAVRTYYDLLRHPYFQWQARSETLSIEGVVVQVDYLDERKFAQAAAAKAKAGAEVVNLTYRSRYVEDPDGQWQGYQDSDASRGWGVSEWSRRVGCGALFDWVTANAILPSQDTSRTGIEKVDRTTVSEIAQISAQALEMRKQLDAANSGLNPLGLATDVVPFDIDPIGFDPGTGTRSMHFDQVYERAQKAMANALDVFNHANDLNNMLRNVAVTADQFAQAAQDQDLDYRNRLIEIFGTPYEGTIGAGKPYPPGYNGPDLYLYMYADVTGIQDVPEPNEEFSTFFAPIPGGFVNAEAPGGGGNSIAEVWSHFFGGDVPNFEDNVVTDFSDVLELKMPRTASGYSFQAPADWGTRRAPGELQQVISEMVQAEADLQLALKSYDGALGDIKDMLVMIKVHSDYQAETVEVLEHGVIRSLAIAGLIATADAVAAGAAFSAELSEDTADAVQESLPRVGGLAVDLTAPARGAIKQTGALAKNASKLAGFAAERSAHVLESGETISQLYQDIKLQKADLRLGLQEQLKELEGLLGEESTRRVEVFRQQEALRQISDKYRALLETGVRLLDERTLHNKRTAGATQQNRYQDFTFRVARNDALAKYRSAFDLAARFVYLAAKAYDYESNLDPNDPASARPMLTKVIRSRTLGAMDDGVPRLGSGGLADAMATMKVNFEVLRSQMGFNNPQGESGQFSLRQELFRIRTNDVAWRQELEKYRVPDLWQIPEFRRFCRPFAPQSAGTQPGLVIPFSSKVIFGRNFFGWPLGAGDSAYDPTLFATKVRSVGVWFDNYAGEGLSTTPRVYLVPAGLDIMYVPNSVEFATREWNVVDQRIPVPLPISQTSLRDPSWIPVRDSLNGTLAEIRRYSSFRAYHNAGFSPEEMTFDSRLVGRSVWNTRWMLIIPGGTFLADQTEGLDTFIYGLRAADGPATDSRGAKRDGHGVTDIKLSFQTYAISGN